LSQHFHSNPLTTMAVNEVKTWYLARSFDWPAEGGPVCLGSIIQDPKKPEKAINSPSFGAPARVFTREQKEWQHIFDKHREGSATLYTEFLRIADLSGQPSGKLATTSTNYFECDKLVTKYFYPDHEYVMERMRDEKVQSSLKRSRSRVFMITGLKLAYNPTAYHLQTRNRGLNVKPGADLTLVGPPVKISLGLDGSSTRTTATSSAGGTDIVFAFQLEEIDYRVSKNGAPPTATTKPRIKGAYMDRDKVRAEAAQEEEEDEVVVFERMFEQGVSAQDVGANGCIVLDDIDDGVCECAVLGLLID